MGNSDGTAVEDVVGLKEGLEVRSHSSTRGTSGGRFVRIYDTVAASG